MTDTKRLPVFVFPSTMNFYAEDTASHKQVVTLYNPYDYPVDFKVLCTAPWKYRIVDPEGSIKAHCCVDVVIRHNSVTPSCFHVTDKFRVQMNDYATKQVLGKKDVTVTLLPGHGDPAGQDQLASSSQVDHFKHFAPSDPSLSESPARRTGHQSVTGPNYLAIAVACVCIVALMLPTAEQDKETSSWWSLFHLSSHQKMVFAYTLGLVTMVILRV